MRYYFRAFGLVAIAILFSGPAFPSLGGNSRAGAEESVALGALVPERNVKAHPSPDGLTVTTREHEGAMVRTPREFTTPLIITAVASVESTDLRLAYGSKGRVILNWKDNVRELRYHDPKSGRQFGRLGQGLIPTNSWVTVRWEINRGGSRIFVDGVERASFSGDYSALSGTVGIGTALGATITVRSLTISAPGPSAPSGAPAEIQPDNSPINISVPCAVSHPSHEATTAPAIDANSIEQPWYQTHPKHLEKDLTSVTSMMVRVADDGQESGFTSDIIATVSLESRHSDKAGVGFLRIDGDAMMKTAFEEAVRAVKLRFPLWEPGHIDVSFGEKFDAHAGPSAGTAFALLMLSTLQGFDLDPKCAVTGDITVDWKVRPVGGVVAKLRGATLDQCTAAVIPDENRAAFADMGVQYGDSAFWDLQVFSIATLQQAVAIARTDRPANIAEAMKLFDRLRVESESGRKLSIHDPKVRDALKHILELAPNHLSAKCLLAKAEGTAPRTLSDSATIYQLSVLFYPYREMLKTRVLDRDTFPTFVTVLARKKLAALRPIANPDLQPALTEIAAFVQAVDNFTERGGSIAEVNSHLQKVRERFAMLDSDPAFLEKVIREGY